MVGTNVELCVLSARLLLHVYALPIMAKRTPTRHVGDV